MSTVPSSCPSMDAGQSTTLTKRVDSHQKKHTKQEAHPIRHYSMADDIHALRMRMAEQDHKNDQFSMCLKFQGMQIERLRKNQFLTKARSLLDKAMRWFVEKLVNFGSWMSDVENCKWKLLTLLLSGLVIRLTIQQRQMAADVYSACSKYAVEIPIRDVYSQV